MKLRTGIEHFSNFSELTILPDVYRMKRADEAYCNWQGARHVAQARTPEWGLMAQKRQKCGTREAVSFDSKAVMS